MNNSSLELVQLKMVKCRFELNTEFVETENVISIGVSLKNNGEFSEDGRQATYTQCFSIGEDQPAPFILNIEYQAVFVLSPPALPLEQHHYVRSVFPQIVFPALKEYVAELTKRAGFSPLLLNQSIFSDERGFEALPELTDGQPKRLH